MRVILRSANKQAKEIPFQTAFVELCNDEGDIMSVISYDKVSGTMDLFDFRDKASAKKYEDFFGVKFIKDLRVVDLDKYNLNK